MSRIAKILDLLTQIQAAAINCKNELREKGESEAFKSFFHALNLIMQTLEEFVEHVKPRADAKAVREIEEKREAVNREARELIEKMTKLLTKGEE